jgi:hypothetical protein
MKIQMLATSEKDKPDTENIRGISFGGGQAYDHSLLDNRCNVSYIS